MLGIDDRNKKVDGMLEKIDELKDDISLIFMRTQNLIISTYFDKAFDRITTLEDVENYRRKLYSFKDYLGHSEGYTFFNDYYVSKMEALEAKYNALENGDIVTALKIITKKESLFIKFIHKIKILLFGNSKKAKELE